jgi:peptidoglycan/xylan/chitin deacetylase (PgdA/CDA1 family)
MKSFVKKTVASRLGWAASAVARARGGYVLTYHRVGVSPYGFKHVTADVFREQMRWLREHCRPIHPNDLQQTVTTGGRLKPPVLVTFDDGYRDYHDVAYPILRELRIPAVNFVATHFTDSGDMFWWDEIDLAVAATVRRRVEVPWTAAPAVTLDNAGRSALRLETRREIKRRPDADRPSIMAALLAALDVRRPLTCDRQVMTWNEIRAVGDLTTIGGHTHTHPLMTRIDVPQLHDETRRCRERIAAEVGAAPKLFAYPSGAFSSEAAAVVREHGFEVAFGSIHGINNGQADWMQVRRVYAPAVRHQLPFVLSGLWTPRGRAGSSGR